MLVIGIAGGIACGKSLVAGQFNKLGAIVLDADKLGHDVLKLEIVKEAVRREFGESVFSDDGEVDREKLGAIVFGDEGSESLNTLESITHPVIRERLNQKLDELSADGRTRAVVLDVPLLFKTGWHRSCDRIVFVDVPRYLRIQRAIHFRNWDEDEIEKREKRQTPVSRKRELADVIIDNSGLPGETCDQVVRLWKDWGFDVPV